MLTCMDPGSQKVIIHTQEAHFSGSQNIGGQKSKPCKVRLKDLREGKSIGVVSLRGWRGTPAITRPVIDMA